MSTAQVILSESGCASKRAIDNHLSMYSGYSFIVILHVRITLDIRQSLLWLHLGQLGIDHHLLALKHHVCSLQMLSRARFRPPNTFTRQARDYIYILPRLSDSESQTMFFNACKTTASRFYRIVTERRKKAHLLYCKD